MPPTPTPLPIIELPMELPEFSAWELTDYSIQFWNRSPEITTAVQAIILIAVIYFILNSLYKYAQAISVDRNG